MIAGLLSRNKNKDESRRFVLVLVDLAALAAQATGLVVWPLIDNKPASLWLIPPALILVSCRWWENYVTIQSPFSKYYYTTSRDPKILKVDDNSQIFFPGIVKTLGRVKRDLIQTRYFTYMFISIWKIFSFTISAMVILRMRGENIGHLFSMLGTAFGEHKITVQAVNTAGGTIPDLLEILPNGETEVVNAEFHTAGHLLLFAIIAAYFVYIFGKFNTGP